MEHTVGDWQRPGTLGDLQMSISLSLLVNFLIEIFSHLLNCLCMHTSVLGGKAGILILDLHLTQNLSVLVVVAQSCLTLCNTMDCSPPGSALLTFWVRWSFVVVTTLSIVEYLAEATHQMPGTNSCQAVTMASIAKYLLTCPTVWELPSSSSLGSKLPSAQSRGRVPAWPLAQREGFHFQLILPSAPPSEESSTTSI